MLVVAEAPYITEKSYTLIPNEGGALVSLAPNMLVLPIDEWRLENKSEYWRI